MRKLVIVVLMCWLPASFALSLVEHLNQIKTMQAQFVQTVFDGQHKPLQRSSGNMALDRPGKFRWDVKEPVPQLIVANHDKLYIYDADLAQLTIRRLQNAAGSVPTLLLSHVTANIENSFQIKPMKPYQSGQEWFELIPKQKDNLFKSIHLGFVKQTLIAMELNDNLGQSTVIAFNSPIVNKPITAAVFEIKPAANVDIVDETKK